MTHAVQRLYSELAGGADLTPMSLGLSHSLSRYKLKFSPEKVGLVVAFWVSCITNSEHAIRCLSMPASLACPTPAKAVLGALFMSSSS